MERNARQVAVLVFLRASDSLVVRQRGGWEAVRRLLTHVLTLVDAVSRRRRSPCDLVIRVWKVDWHHPRDCRGGPWPFRPRQPMLGKYVNGVV